MLETWPVYELVTEGIITWSEVKNGTVTIMDCERLYHALEAKAGVQRRASKNRE